MSFNWPSQCFDVPGELEANPDVGGIGVLVGFIGTAWFSTLLVVLHYLLVFNPEENPFEDGYEGLGSPGSTQDWVPNHVDQTALKAFARFSQWLDRKLPAFVPRWPLRREYLIENDDSNKWAKALKDAVRNICDVQLLTGPGILLSGFINLGSSSISAYHWHLIAYLAWFSHLTHIACLTVSRRELHRSQAKRRLRT
ncbi:hypothetical protein LX32DRAFT_645815 [Colletotrichum zoysiae]|uniref:Uncharacterized protein n=1 Tax=Colletotrichum zoysiae TaxID=1216348 RepID=A0AAD9LXP5_9PEZI|nr:hypothetical protein LX32DRAFT_645815 [Colletotrichum zoysiae]